MFFSSESIIPAHHPVLQLEKKKKNKNTLSPVCCKTFCHSLAVIEHLNIPVNLHILTRSNGDV